MEGHHKFVAVTVIAMSFAFQRKRLAVGDLMWVGEPGFHRQQRGCAGKDHWGPNRLRQGHLLSVTRERERIPSRHLDKFKEVAVLQATGSQNSIYR